MRGQSVFVSLNCPGSINHTLDTRPKIKKKGATKRLKQKYTWRLDGILKKKKVPKKVKLKINRVADEDKRVHGKVD